MEQLQWALAAARELEAKEARRLLKILNEVAIDGDPIDDEDELWGDEGDDFLDVVIRASDLPRTLHSALEHHVTDEEEMARLLDSAPTNGGRAIPIDEVV